ncbi:hypothetical protein BC943DRAFT_318615 [Umbelopsis sp. AD052]|nr:hypothetical protein BC943DRAFT_318615 [Umbelopsis sp. AD052]
MTPFVAEVAPYLATSLNAFWAFRSNPRFWSILLFLMFIIEQFSLFDQMSHLRPPTGTYWLH